MNQSEATAGELPRMPPAFEYRAMRTVARPLFRILFGFRVTGRQHVPSEGGIVLAALHRSNADVPFLAAACPRPVHFMAKAELFTLPFLGAWFRRLGAFPVEREGTGKTGLVGAAGVLERGEVLGIFPEGRIDTGGSIGRMQRGAAWLALRHGATLVPAAIGGADRVLPPRSRMVRPARISVVFGEPLELPAARGRAAVDETTERLRQALRSLYEESQGSTRH